MRFFLILIVLLYVSGVAQSQTSLDSLDSRKPVYFLVDASGTMKNVKAEAEKKLAARIGLLDSGRWISVSYFGGGPDTHSGDDGGADGCAAQVSVADPILAEQYKQSFPTLGGDTQNTSIGKALEAALAVSGDNAEIVLITDGVEECESDFSLIRKNYPTASIEVFQVGDNINTALNMLEIFPNFSTTAPILNISHPVPVTLTPAVPTAEAKWVFRSPWIVVLILSTLSVTLFCLQSGQRTNRLRDQLFGLESKSPDDLALIYSAMTKVKGKEVRVPEHKRFEIYWFRNRDHGLISHGTFALVLLLLALLGWLCLVFKEPAELFLQDEVARKIRYDCWRFLNSNIGAYTFVGTIITLAGFSAFQWWQTLEVKKDLMVRSGIISSERRKVVRNSYEKTRGQIRKTKFLLPKISFGWFGGERVEIPGFDALQKLLLDIAAPAFKDATMRRQLEIERFLNIRDPLAFARLLAQADEISQDHVGSINQLLKHAEKQEIEEASQLTLQLVNELSANTNLDTSA